MKKQYMKIFISILIAVMITTAFGLAVVYYPKWIAYSIIGFMLGALTGLLASFIYIWLFDKTKK